MVPDGVRPKLDLYTLACKLMFERLPMLIRATASDLDSPLYECISRFDDVLRESFREGRFRDIEHAASRFAGTLRERANLLSDSNEAAGAVLCEVADGVLQAAHGWDYRRELDRLHVLGRDLAVAFFAPARGFKRQRNCTCHLIVDFLADGVDPPVLAPSEDPCSWGATHMAYRPRHLDGNRQRSDVLLMRFTFRHNFSLYMGLPYLFLHEYTAHVFAADHLNEQFNDGWMLFAAREFLRSGARDDFRLHSDQVWVVDDALVPSIPRNRRQGFDLAREFQRTLATAGLQSAFDQYTYELAGFVPRAGERASWPDEFINSVRAALTDPERLLARVRQTSNVRELRAALPPV